jgi:hypothetical protein
LPGTTAEERGPHPWAGLHAAAQKLRPGLSEISNKMPARPA